MNKTKEREVIGSKPVVYPVIAVLVLLFVNLIFQNSGSGIVKFLSNIYLFPVFLEFDSSLGSFIAGIVSCLIALILFVIVTEKISSKSGFYFWETIVSYFVCSGFWFFIETMILAIHEIGGKDEMIPWMVTLFLSFVAIIFTFSGFYFQSKEVYEDMFINHSSTPLPKTGEKETNNSSNSSSKGTFEENTELAERIRKKIVSVSTGTVLSFDSNIMIKCPLLVKELSETYPIVLSKQVFTELDKKKTDKEIGANARMAMRTIESIQKRDGELEIIAIDETFLKENGFSLESPDDIIVGTCLKRQKNEENILFVSEDRGARITAKNAKLNVLYF
jgi:hypothetical protein